MKEETKLIRELREFFSREAVEIRKKGRDVSITKDTFYTTERHKLMELEMKYHTYLWCEARNGKVYYMFHTIGRNF